MARLRREFTRGRPRQTSWEAGTGSTGTTTVNSTTPSFVGQAVQAVVDGLTLVRTRGHLRVTLTSQASALDGFRFAFGIGIATFAAVNAGIASVPTPITEQDWDGWLYWSSGAVLAITGTEADGANALVIDHKEVIDSKAMRKFGEDMALYAAFEAAETGTGNLQIHHDSRMLFKLA